MTGRNEKLAVRGQIFENLRANSRAIWRKLSEIWTGQTILQSVYDKADTLLVHVSKCCTEKQRIVGAEFTFSAHSLRSLINLAITKPGI